MKSIIHRISDDEPSLAVTLKKKYKPRENSIYKPHILAISKLEIAQVYACTITKQQRSYIIKCINYCKFYSNILLIGEYVSSAHKEKVFFIRVN